MVHTVLRVRSIRRALLKATKNVTLPTRITGSPRPVRHTESLGMRTFLAAMRNSKVQEQYLDTVAVHLKDEETAGPRHRYGMTTRTLTRR
jgi:hypothetical protein